MLTVREFAAKLRLDPSRIRQFLTERRIPKARKFDHVWQIPSNAKVDARKRGRPRRA